MNRAIFLDRDGTLIKNKGYICEFKDVEFYPFSLEALKLINSHNFQVVVVTNQSSIARGICSEEEIIQIHIEMEKYLKTQGIFIQGFYYCPYYRNSKIIKYKIDSFLRKPNPGMLIKSAKELNINLKQSYMIGDNITDILAGERAGCKTVLVKTGHGYEFLSEIKKKNINVDIVSENLLQAVREIFGGK